MWGGLVVSRRDVALLVERIKGEVAPGPDELVGPPGYAHISLALVDAVYSIRMRYSAVRRVVAAYCQASETQDQPLAARGGTGVRERGRPDWSSVSQGRKYETWALSGSAAVVAPVAGMSAITNLQPATQPSSAYGPRTRAPSVVASCPFRPCRWSGQTLRPGLLPWSPRVDVHDSGG